MAQWTERQPLEALGSAAAVGWMDFLMDDAAHCRHCGTAAGQVVVVGGWYCAACAQWQSPKLRVRVV